MPVYPDKKTNTYYIKINYKEDGKYKQILRRGFETKKKAKAAEAEIKDKINKGVFIKESNITYSEFMQDYLNDKKMNVKKGTWSNYANLVNNHILPMLGELEISKITPRHIQNLYNDLFETSKLSDENIQKVHTLINDSLKKAEAWEMINKNPTTLVERPKARKKEMQVWSLEETHQFLLASKSDRYYIVFLLALTTGMRQGEILGLRWKDVDFDRRIISVTQILSHDGKSFESGAKTKAGSRPIKVDEETMNELKKHQQIYREEKMANRTIYQDNDLVVCTSLGTPVSPRNINRSFYRLIEKSEVKKIRFHDLRHTHVTFLIKNRETPQAIAERMGWSDTRMIDNYAHIRPDIQEDTAELFGKTFYNNKSV